MKTLTYYLVQNTGWSGGISWFDSDYRFESFQEAEIYQKSAKWNDERVLWRIVEVVIVRYYQDETNPKNETKKLTTERYLYI